MRRPKVCTSQHPVDPILATQQDIWVVRTGRAGPYQAESIDATSWLQELGLS